MAAPIGSAMSQQGRLWTCDAGETTEQGPESASEVEGRRVLD